MKSLLFAFVLTSALVINACDVIEAPYLKNPIDPSDTLLKDTSLVRVSTDGLQHVLLEDYTGHTCVNCPEAADVAKAIYSKYKPRVVVVSVHAGPFAKPSPPDYMADFRTEAGELLDQTFRVSRVGNPNGLVNRTKYNGTIVVGQNNWEPATVALLAASPKLDLTLSHTYYADKRTIVATVESKFLQAGENDYSVVAWIIEDSIIGDQADDRRTPSHVEDYEFEHVLRGSLNGTWGDSLSSDNEPAGTTVKKTIRYTIPEDKDWKLENCQILAYVIRRKDANTREVLQVVKQAFRP